MLSHNDKKPGCGSEVMDYFRKYPETGVTSPAQVAIVGDRLTTDIMMANMMGAWGFWVKDGVVPLNKKSIVGCTPSIGSKSLADERIVFSNGEEFRGVYMGKRISAKSPDQLLTPLSGRY